MSGIFGIFNRNGKPVDEKIAEDMLESMSSWNPDESNLWLDGPIALGHTMLWNTPESKFEHLPLKNDTHVLTMDARIDNREELVNELELPDRPLNEIGDSEFILAAYKKWGEECPKHLLGDFAFAIWDEEKQQLFCARDHVGIKLLYYSVSDDLIVFSNDIETILAHSKIAKILDDQTVATFLKDEGIHTRRATFFQKIKKLPASTTLTATKSSIIENKYWRIEQCSTITYDTYEEYVEKLKELFDSAVEARLRTVFPVTSHLSGGIDSSPIAVLAARKLSKRNQKLYAFNWINVPEGDEYEYEAWHFSRRIALSENIIHKEFSIDPQYIAQQYEEHNFLIRGTMYYWEEYAVQDMVNDIGARTLLSGWGGDELISNRYATYATYLFNKREILETIKYLYYEKQYYNYSWNKIIKKFLGYILSPEMIKIIKILKNKKDDDEIDFDNICTTKEYSIFMNTHRCKKYPIVPEIRKNQLVMYHYGHLQNRIESWALSAFPKKIEYRYPLLDKRIVEFAIGIPEEIFYPKKGIDRHLMRSAVADLLPIDIVWFPKPNESKINKSNKRRYIATLKLIREMYKDKDIHLSNKYVDFVKIRQILDTFDFEKYDSSKLDNVAVAIQLINSMKHL